MNHIDRRVSAAARAIPFLQIHSSEFMLSLSQYEGRVVPDVGHIDVRNGRIAGTAFNVHFGAKPRIVAIDGVPSAVEFAVVIRHSDSDIEVDRIYLGTNDLTYEDATCTEEFASWRDEDFAPKWLSRISFGILSSPHFLPLP